MRHKHYMQLAASTTRTVPLSQKANRTLPVAEGLQASNKIGKVS